MMKKHSRGILAHPLCLSLIPIALAALLAGGAAAQNEVGNTSENKPQQKQKEKTVENDPGDADRGASGRANQPDGSPASTGIRPGSDAKEAAGGGAANRDPEVRTLRRIALEEAKHRKRLATINRLRDLAREQGNEQRLEALDKLEARLDELHERKVNRWRERLGDEKYERFQQRMNRAAANRKEGRGRGRPNRADPGGTNTDDRQNRRPEDLDEERSNRDPGDETGNRGTKNDTQGGRGNAPGEKPERDKPASTGNQPGRGGPSAGNKPSGQGPQQEKPRNDPPGRSGNKPGGKTF